MFKSISYRKGLESVFFYIIYENEVLSRESKEWSNAALFGYVTPKIILATGVPGHPECEVTRKASKMFLSIPTSLWGAGYT